MTAFDGTPYPNGTQVRVGGEYGRIVVVGRTADGKPNGAYVVEHADGTRSHEHHSRLIVIQPMGGEDLRARWLNDARWLADEVDYIRRLSQLSWVPSSNSIATAFERIASRAGAVARELRAAHDQTADPERVDCPSCGRNMEPLGELHTADCPRALAQDAADAGLALANDECFCTTPTVATNEHGETWCSVCGERLLLAGGESKEVSA